MGYCIKMNVQKYKFILNKTKKIVMPIPFHALPAKRLDFAGKIA